MKMKNSKANRITPSEAAFFFEQTPENNHLYRWLICLLKGFLIFCATFGTIAGVLNAFSISYNEPALFFVLLFLCFCLAGLHYNRLVFNLFYPVIFVLFTGTIFKYRRLANSGFQAFMSILYEEYSSHFELSFIRETLETNTNRYLTITVAAIFVGFVLALLINVAISTHMSVLLTILLTAPILQVGIYIGLYPEPIYFVPLVFSYLTIGILGSFKHHAIPSRKKERTEYKLIKRQNNKFHVYRTNGKVMFQTTVLFAVCSLAFLIVFYPFVLRNVNEKDAINSVKKKTDEYVKVFVQSGLSGFFNRYSSTGGLSGGRLGGVSSVRPDYQTDLVVTFAPYSFETVYLRAFVGTDYLGNAWSDNEIGMTALSDIYDTTEKADKYIDFTTFLEVNRLEHYREEGGTFSLEGKMDVQNIDANENYLYTPYYTKPEPYGIYSIKNHVMTGRSVKGGTQTHTFYPVLKQLDDLSYPAKDSYAESLALNSDELSYLNTYRDYCYENYTYVPDNLIKPLKKVIDQIGYGSGIQDKASRINNYFTTNYVYSMSPGNTPIHEDFIAYFLTDQNQGYCAHFASAATMLFRYMGVPARYVEGYSIPPSSVAEADTAGYKYEDYLSGTSPIGETGVVTVEVSDARAHAWVEVYSDGFGWVPIEVTPPSTDIGNDYPDFLSAFSDLFSATSIQGGSDTLYGENATRSRTRDLYTGTNHLLIPMLVLFFCLLLFYPLSALVHHIFWYISKEIAYRKEGYDKVVIYYYRKLFLTMLKKKQLPEPPHEFKTILLREKLSYMHTFSPQKLTAYLKEDDIESYIDLLEKALYSRNGITHEEAIRFKEMTLRYLKKK